jgi:hypothetical protein
VSIEDVIPVTIQQAKQLRPIELQCRPTAIPVQAATKIENMRRAFCATFTSNNSDVDNTVSC